MRSPAHNFIADLTISLDYFRVAQLPLPINPVALCRSRVTRLPQQLGRLEGEISV